MSVDLVENRYAGQVAVVSGGASGIGQAVAARLVAEGGQVVLLDIAEENLARTAEKLGDAASYACVDVSDEDSVNRAIAEVADRTGRIDVLVHSAGITGPTGKKITEISVEDYDRVYGVNQRSAFLLAKAVIPHMEKADYGRILMFASIAGKDGNPGMAPYTSTKAAVIGLVKGLGKEYATTGITVNGVAPAVIRTPMNEGTSQEQLDYMTARIPMERLGTVDEAAALAAWACSRESSFTTGFIFDLSGGRAVY